MAAIGINQSGQPVGLARFCLHEIRLVAAGAGDARQTGGRCATTGRRAAGEWWARRGLSFALPGRQFDGDAVDDRFWRHHIGLVREIDDARLHAQRGISRMIFFPGSSWTASPLGASLARSASSVKA